MHIRQKGHTIHMFDEKFEIRRSSNNMVIMVGWDDERLLNFKGTFAQAYNFRYLSHQDEGTFSSLLLWHVVFGNINYHSIHMLNFFFPSIPSNLKQCDAVILGKHSKQLLHDSTLRESRNIELIHSNLCGPIPIAYYFVNKYIITFIDDYTMMYSVYLLKNKSQAFEAFKSFHVWIENEEKMYCHSLVLIMKGNILLMSLKYILYNMGLIIKPQFHTILNRMLLKKIMNMAVLNMVCSMLFFKNVKLMF
jgi:hypothetical protein